MARDLRTARSPAVWEDPMKPRVTLLGFVTGLLLVSAAAQGCSWPSAPQCFRRGTRESVYICEWSSPYKDWNHTVHISPSPKGPFLAESPNMITIREENLFQHSEVVIWVEARGTGNASCKSKNITVTLNNKIKYDKPQNVMVTWSRENLTLQWDATEAFRAQVEIRHRRDSAQPWSQQIYKTTALKNNKHRLTVVILEQLSVQQLQMRQRPIHGDPLWSEWSEILTTPIEFVKISKRLLNTTRAVKLRWKPVPSDGEVVSYKVETHSFKCHNQSSQPLVKVNTTRTFFILNGSYAAVNISIAAWNSASLSPTVVMQVPPENPPSLDVCDAAALGGKNKKICSEWYELRDGKVKTRSFKSSDELQEFLPYVYYEHSCKKPRTTEKKCIYYTKQEKPVWPPPNFITTSESPTSVTLSWDTIPTEKQRGFITHYVLSVTATSAEQQPDRRNISASLRSYRIEKLTPATKYNISLKGVTVAGEGPHASLPINTPPEKPYNVWLSFGLLIGFFLLSILFTFIFTRIKNKVLPPVPVPVIPDFETNNMEVQDLLERKEEVHEVTLFQRHPEHCPPDDMKSGRLSGTSSAHLSDLEEDTEGGDSLLKDPRGKPADMVQNEIAQLIYRNGLVFDVNLDSS